MFCCSINYKIQLEEKAKISINERGFLFGDGVFETCRIVNGKIYNFLAHKERLASGLKAIKIDFDLSELEENIAKLIAKNDLKSGLARIYISRGQGSIGFAPLPNIRPLIIIQNKELPKKPTEPIKLWVSDIRKISNKSLPIQYKLAAGGLNSALAKMEAQEQGCFDVLLLDDLGNICETSSANIFWIKDKILYTPSDESDILLGTVRKKIIDLSILPVKKIKCDLADLLKAEEIFISNVVYGILKIDHILSHGWQSKSDQYFNIFDQLLEKDFKK